MSTYTLRARELQIHIRTPITRDLLSELPGNIAYQESPTGIVQYMMLVMTNFDGLLVCEMCDTPTRPYLLLSGVVPHHESWHLLCASHFRREPLDTLDRSVSCLLCPPPFMVRSPTVDGFIVRSSLRNIIAESIARGKFCRGCKIVRLEDGTRLCPCCAWYLRYHVVIWWHIRRLHCDILPVDVAGLVYDARMLEDHVLNNEVD